MVEQKHHRTAWLATWLSACLVLAGCGGSSDNAIEGAGTSAGESGSPNAEAAPPPTGSAAAGGSGSRAGSPAPVADKPTTTTAAKAGALTIAWIAPQINADGTPLTDLGGYRVRYGTRSGRYSSVIDVDSAQTLNYALKSLPADTYYLVVTAYNTSNVEGAASAEVSKTIR